MSAAVNTETVYIFEHGGRTFEVDHLGIGHANQAGTYVVYEGGIQLSEFVVVDESQPYPVAVVIPPSEEMKAHALSSLIEVGEL